MHPSVKYAKHQKSKKLKSKAWGGSTYIKIVRTEN